MAHAYRGQKTTCSLFLPSTKWVLRMELGSSGLAASTFIHLAFLQALDKSFWHMIQTKMEYRKIMILTWIGR